MHKLFLWRNQALLEVDIVIPFGTIFQKIPLISYSCFKIDYS
ncbi:hypothetical protein HMPREF1869_01332 [Bacteroidales bacterium KA00251]|nr:hypothetical protein HMPREF1869_01332 [Bacteroidales bacterium KA00251]